MVCIVWLVSFRRFSLFFFFSEVICGELLGFLACCSDLG